MRLTTAFSLGTGLFSRFQPFSGQYWRCQIMRENRAEELWHGLLLAAEMTKIFQSVYI
jgi:hypothetical protein